VRRLGEGDIKKFSVEVRRDPVLVVKSVELDRMTEKLQDRYFEGPIGQMALSVQTGEDGKFKSANLYNRRTGMGMLEIPLEAQYLAIKKVIDEEQARLAKEKLIR